MFQKQDYLKFALMIFLYDRWPYQEKGHLQGGWIERRGSDIKRVREGNVPAAEQHRNELVRGGGAISWPGCKVHAQYLRNLDRRAMGENKRALDWVAMMATVREMEVTDVSETLMSVICRFE